MNMSTDEYRAALKALDLRQEEFGKLVGASARTGQNWALRYVPPVVSTLVRLLVARPELLPVVREINRQHEETKP